MTKLRATLLALVVAIPAVAISQPAVAAPMWDEPNVLSLPSMGRSSRQSVDSCEFLSNGALALTGKAGAWLPGGQQTKRSASRFMTAIVNTSGRVEGARSRSWVSAQLPRNHKELASDFSPAGSFAYVSSPLSDKRSTTFVLRKRSANGKRGRRFGRRGTVTLKLSAQRTQNFWTRANVLLLKDGGVLLAINRHDGLRLVRYTRSGRRAEWGKNGILRLAGSTLNYWFLPTSAVTPLLETNAGGIIVAASARPGESSSGGSLGILALDSRGNVDGSFADRGLWTPPGGTDVNTSPTPPGAVMQVLESSEGFTVLHANGGPRSQIGFALELYASRLSRAGQMISISGKIDEATNQGDGGFPLTRPFDFAATDRGWHYSSAQTFPYRTGATSHGVNALWSGEAGGGTTRQIYFHDRFLPVGTATTIRGHSVYMCGARDASLSRHKKSWAVFRPALATHLASR